MDAYFLLFFTFSNALQNTVIGLIRTFLLFLTTIRHIAEDDILLREELEALVKEFPDKFKLHYTVDRPKDDTWKYSSGFVTKEMIEEFCLFNGSSKDTQVFMCGPPPMIKFACLPNLKELGFTEKDWFAF